MSRVVPAVRVGSGPDPDDTAAYPPWDSNPEPAD